MYGLYLRVQLMTSPARSSKVTSDPPDTYGELGIRHEDAVAVTENGCENLAPRWSGTPEEPAVG
jgi:Xaa-Pro aminopeptidase